MIQSNAADALPHIGPLVGAAYDRAVTTLFQSWRVVVVLLLITCIVGGVPVLARSSIGNIPGFAWNFYAMANSIRIVFDPDYRMSNRTAGSMFGVQLTSAITFVLINFVIIVALVQPTPNATSWLLAIPGAVVGTWIFVRWSCAPALGAKGMPATRALAESWRLTSVAFWPTFALPIMNFVATFGVGIVINVVAGILVHYQTPGLVTNAIPVAAAALTLFAQLYVTQAYDLAICMWLKALNEAQPASLRRLKIGREVSVD